ncbi:MAG: hypothetical protein AAGF20_01415 [Pseudomonadota bacterium]
MQNTLRSCPQISLVAALNTLVCGALCMAFTIGAAADEASDASPGKDESVNWSDLTRKDLTGARDIILSSHPAGAEAFGDTAFLAAEAEAYDRLMAKAQTVQSAGGYRALLTAYALSFNDSHIAPSFDGEASERLWPGFLAKRWDGRTWIAFSTIDAVPVGSEVLACDQTPIAAYGEARLGQYVRNWTFEANRIKATPYLFIDSGNPFTTPPGRCDFKVDGEIISYTLSYRPFASDPQHGAVQSAFRRQDQYTMDSFGADGLWISLPQLYGEAYRFLDTLETQKAQIAAAKVVIVDVRGNGGGNSALGDRLADLLGLPHEATDHSDDNVSWRLSRGNLEAIESYLEDPDLGAEVKDYIREMVADGTAALQAGEQYMPPLAAVPVRRPSLQSAVERPSEARVILLTDAYCFSSCLMLAHRFIAGGALQVGTVTDGDGWFMEVASRPLPSGRARFSTMMKVNLNYDQALGPFQPQIAYGGDMSDTAALKAWVQTIRDGAFDD